MNQEFEHFRRPVNLSDYVRVYDNVLDADACASLIESFDADPRTAQRENQYMYFAENNISRNEWDVADLYESVLQYRERYLTDLELPAVMMPTEHSYEEMRMRKFRSGIGDHFFPHVDVVGNKTMSRQLSFIWFLNTATACEVDFMRLDQPIKIAAQTGRLLVFPSTWQYLYQITEPTDTDVYMIASHVHYTDLYQNQGEQHGDN